MLEKIKNLVSKIEENKKELKEIKSKVDELDKERLSEVVEIAQKGLKYSKIGERKSRWDNTIHYHKNDKGEYLKGILVEEVSSDNLEGVYGEYDYDSELWLMNNGTFTKMIYDCRTEFNDQNVYTREINKEDVDVFTDKPFNNSSLLKHEDENIWDVDNIIYRITDALVERLDDLGSRTETQQKRLEKIEQITIK